MGNAEGGAAGTVVILIVILGCCCYCKKKNGAVANESNDSSGIVGQVAGHIIKEAATELIITSLVWGWLIYWIWYKLNSLYHGAECRNSNFLKFLKNSNKLVFCLKNWLVSNSSLFFSYLIQIEGGVNNYLGKSIRFCKITFQNSSLIFQIIPIGLIF